MRVLWFAVAALAAFAFLLAANGWLHAHGYLAAPVLHDWGAVVLYGDGKGSFREFTTTYPPFAFALGILTGVPARELSSVPPPFVTAALLATLILAVWVAALRSAGYGAGWSLVLTALVCLHPFFLYLATRGAGAVLLLIAVYWFASAYCASRIKGRVTDFMSLALALAFVAFTHPVGALIGALALPFLALALPPALLARSALNALLVLLFPVLFLLASFAYENALFENDAMAFIGDAFRHVLVTVRVGTGYGRHFSGPLVWIVVGAVAAATLVAAMPAAIVLVLRMRRTQEPAARPLAALTAIASLAVAVVSIVAMTWGEAANSPLLLEAAAPFVALAVVAVRHWPSGPRRHHAAAALLLSGLVLGWGVAILWRSGEPAQWRDALMGTPVDDEQNAGAVALGRYLAARSDVLIDAQSHPAVIAARGSARGLVLPGDDGFMQTMLTHRIRCRFFAVPDPDVPAILDDDLVSQSFPKIYERGADGYRLIYDANGWRVYERNDARHPV